MKIQSFPLFVKLIDEYTVEAAPSQCNGIIGVNHNREWCEAHGYKELKEVEQAGNRATYADMGGYIQQSWIHYEYPLTEEEQLAVVVRSQINTFELADDIALQVKSLYPEWENFIGQAVKAKAKLQYDGKLFKVRQDHTVQGHYPPSIHTASLYEEINESNKGTIDDPIPYNGNMEIFKDKYYTETGVKYKCTRDSGIALTHPLSALIGHYVEVVT